MNHRSGSHAIIKNAKFFWIGMGLGVFFWVVESAVHTVVFHEGHLLRQIHSPEPHEIWMRLIVVVLFVAFGIYTQFMMTKCRQAEEKAKNAYGELEQIFNTAADGMCVIDREFKVLRVNKTFSSLSGASEKEAVGKRCYEVFRGPLCHTPRCPLALILDGEDRVESDAEKERNDGNTVHCIVTATPYRGVGGDLVGIVENLKEITHRKEAEKALRESGKRFRELADLLPQPVYEMDASGRVTFLNRRAYELSGYTDKDFAEGMNALEFFVQDDWERAKENIAKMLRGEQLGGNEYTARRKDGSTFPVVVHSAPIAQENGVVGLRGVIVDMTERKQAEKALKKAHDDLGKRVEERTAQLAEANYRLKLEIEERKRAEDALKESMVRTEIAYKQAIIYAHELKNEIVKRDQAEEELRKYRYHLEEQVENRTAELRRSNEQLQQEIAERRKTELALRASERQLRFLSSELLTAQEGERRRLSIELHDELGQALMVFKLKVRSIQGELSEDQAGLKRDCDVMIGYINEVADNVSRLSRDLRPSILEDLGLLAAIQWLVDTSTRHSGIEGSVDVADIEDLFSQETQIIIYRIIQECLTNVAKHAQASKVFVTMKRKQGHVLFCVADDGKGFDVREVLDKDASEKGLGLAAMYERTRMAGGSLDIWSQEGEGTRITFTIPMIDGGSRE